MKRWMWVFVGAVVAIGCARQPSGPHRESRGGAQGRGSEQTSEVRAPFEGWPSEQVVVRGRLSAGEPALILLHGYGAPGADLLPFGEWLRSANDDVAVVVPAAPIALPHGGRAWFPLPGDWRERRARGEDLGRLALPGLSDAVAAVERVLGEVVRSGASPIVIAGFSQGAMMALHVGARSEHVEGIWAMSGMAIDRERWVSALPGRRLRIVLSHGLQDPIVPFSEMQRLTRIVLDAGVNLVQVPFQGGHTIAPDVRNALVGEMRQIRRGPEAGRSPGVGAP